MHSGVFQMCVGSFSDNFFYQIAFLVEKTKAITQLINIS
jgi:hypothetical protein